MSDERTARMQAMRRQTKAEIIEHYEAAVETLQNVGREAIQKWEQQTDVSWVLVNRTLNLRRALLEIAQGNNDQAARIAKKALRLDQEHADD